MNKNNIIQVAFCILFMACTVDKPALNTSKVILITLDGLRWQELFSGADSLLVTNKAFVDNPEALKSEFWRATSKERRKALFPFVWEIIEKQGQLHGNRKLGSKMNLTNGMHFSYPGYNEILTGQADDTRINSNKKMSNPNMTILEYAQKSEKYVDRVAAFGSWDVFPFIVNEERSGLYVNAGFKKAKGLNLTTKEVFLNELQDQVPSPWGSVRLDAFTHHYALETMKEKHPNLVYIAYGETDDFAHDGKYDAYLHSAKNTDAFLRQLWNFVQQDPFYKDQTTILITTDHGRGTEPLETWKHHGNSIKNTDQVWLIALGKGVEAKGEIAFEEQIYTNQLASTIAELLSLEFRNKNIGQPFEFVK